MKVLDIRTVRSDVRAAVAGVFLLGLVAPLVVIVLASFAALSGSDVTQPLQGDKVAAVQDFSLAPDKVAAADVSVAWGGPVEVTLENPNGGVLWTNWLAAMLPCAFIIVGAVVLLRFVLALPNRPFSRTTATALRTLALLLLAAWVALPVVNAIAASVFETQVTGEAGGWSMQFDFLPLLGMVLLFVLAAAFDRGEQMAHDVDGLV